MSIGCWMPPAFAGIDVQVHGLGYDERENTYAQLAILDYAKRTDAAKAVYDPAEVKRMYERAEADIRGALQPFGWYRPIIHSELRGSAPDWTAVFDVDAGPPVTIAKIDILLAGEGADNEALRTALARFGIKQGERLKHADYEDAKLKLAQQSVAQGFLDSLFTRHELRVDPAANTAEILLTLDTGARYYFGAVDIQQDTDVDTSVIRRYVSIVEGEPFDSGKLLDTQFALGDLDYFKLVEVEPLKERAGADHRVPIQIRASGKAPRLYRFGAGYGTDTGLRALAGVEWRHLDARGDKLRLELRPSQRVTTGVLDYKIPYGSVPGENYNLSLQGLNQDFQGIRERLYSIGGGYTRLRGAWQQHYYLTYSNDRYQLSDEPGRSSTLLTPGVNLSHTQTNDAIYPTSGWFANLDVHGATRYVLSDSNFLQSDLKLHTVFPLGPDLRLYARAEEGVTVTSDFANLPPSQRFFAGGDESVRGYSYQSLAPLDSYGHLAGGRYLTTGSVEAEYDFRRHYGVAVFGDAGGADDRLAVHLHEGVGIGLRYRAPFGAIRVDLAHPLDNGAELIHLHIGVRVGL